MLHGMYYDNKNKPVVSPCRNWDYRCCCLCCHISTIRTMLPFIQSCYVNCITSVICICIYRRRRQRKKRSFLQFSQLWPWTLNRFTENDPVALAVVLEPSADGKDQVDLRVDPTPGVYYMHSVYIHVYIISHRYNNAMYIIFQDMNKPVYIP